MWPKMTTTLKKVISQQDMDINDARFYDGAYLSDGHLVVSEYHKGELLLLDTSVTIHANYDTLNGPRGLCISADGTLIYVMHFNGMLVTYRIQGGLKKVSCVIVQHNSTGVGVSEDTIITGHEDTITLYNKKGEKLSSISKTGYNTIICMSRDHNNFFHRDGNHIVCRKVSNLEEVFRYSHPELKDPWGISCDKHGNILVAGHEYGNIILINKNGTEGRVLLHKLNSIKHPTAVCCHPEHDEFVVTTYNEDIAMEVYELR